MFEGVRRSYALLTLFLMEAIEDLGTDRALEMLQESVEKQAVIIERGLRREIPGDLGPLEKGVEIYRAFMEGAGAEFEVHKRGEDSVTFRVGRCPFYEALLDVGVDCGYFLGGLCTHITLPAIQATLARFDPRLRLETRLVRESAEEFCLERLYLD
ncbi:MAG: L-2-amino-thiazoline-4-carboxylic acid hydrolase [Candidatus Bathyarchaeota archaeon]|nr:L-2-amino-thiazoline-4-carboxylic acid hydrolase [Candidatus Bathyarchaeota archaeon]